MELHQVRYFLAVCETRNFTRAAGLCHVSQPSLTRGIKLLEAELGGPLFNRERGNTHLTELGGAVLPHLREAATQAAAARERASALLTLELARLSVGIGFGAAFAHLEAPLRRFMAAHPEVEVALVEDDADRLRAALRRGELELALLPDRPHDIDDLHYCPVGADRAQLLLRPDHRLAGRPTVAARELAGDTLIARDGCSYMAAVERHLATGGLGVRRRITARTPVLLAALVACSGGVGLRGERFGVPPGLRGCAVAELQEPGQVHLGTKRGRRYSPPVRAFVDLVAPRRSGPAGGAEVA